MGHEHFDLVAVGTGFATSFFLHRFLEQSGPQTRVLVLEAGRNISHHEQTQLASGDERWARQLVSDQFINQTPDKAWNFFTAFGGASNCWVACTPRLLPEDFELNSKYGIGEDWPISYDDLEPYYCDAEDMMQISGDSDNTPCPRSRPYPQPPHAFTDPDKVLKDAFPDQFFSHPCARSPRHVPGQRPPCCNNGICTHCPIDAKFTILNAMGVLYGESRVTLKNNAPVRRFEYNGNAVKSVVYLENGREREVRCDLLALGANALFNPFIMLNSGLEESQLGKGLGEQVTRSVTLNLKGLDNYQGTTVSTGLGYMCYSGDHRKDSAAALIQTDNRPILRNLRGRWLQTLRLHFIFEDFRDEDNLVRLSQTHPEKPEVEFVRRSRNTETGLAAIEDYLEKLTNHLPVETYTVGTPWNTDSHIMGTTVMGANPATSVVDGDCVHHRFRNLIVLGSGSFPTFAPANPTLTISALALRTAQRLFSS